MFISFIDFLCCSIWHMFSECRQLDEELNEFNRMAVEEKCVIIITKVVWICHTIVTPIAQFPRLTANCVGQFLEPFEWSVEQSEVPDGCHRRVPDKLVNTSSPHVMVCVSNGSRTLLRVRAQVGNETSPNWWSVSSIHPHDVFGYSSMETS